MCVFEKALKWLIYVFVVYWWHFNCLKIHVWDQRFEGSIEWWVWDEEFGSNKEDFSYRYTLRTLQIYWHKLSMQSSSNIAWIGLVCLILERCLVKAIKTQFKFCKYTQFNLRYRFVRFVLNYKFKWKNKYLCILLYKNTYVFSSYLKA